MTDAADPWRELGRRFVDDHYSTLRGQVRTHVLHQHLLEHLPPPPARIVDVGGGAGHQSIPLALAGYDVTIVDMSASMLERAAANAARAGADGMRFVRGSGEAVARLLPGERFDAALCHGVIMYVDDPVPLASALCAAVDAQGIVSIVAKNVEALAVRPALAGDWTTALAAFDSDRQVNGLGVADARENLERLLIDNGVDPVAWYGVRLFTDGWTPDRPATDPADAVLAVELEASRRDPYRQMSRLFHVVGRRR